MSVQDFLTRLATIKRAPWQGGKAPHKPVLLLAVADWFEEKIFIDNHLPFDGDLVNLIKKNWGSDAESEVGKKILLL